MIKFCKAPHVLNFKGKEGNRKKFSKKTLKKVLAFYFLSYYDN